MDCGFMCNVVGGALLSASSAGNRCLRTVKRKSAPAKVNMVFASPAQPAPTDDPLRHIASVIIDFMNDDHKRDLVQYLLNFGKKVEDPTQLDEVSLSGVTEEGLTMDVVLCDRQDERCVCIQETIPWMGNRHCHSIGDVTEALGQMSLACGLPGEF